MTVRISSLTKEFVKVPTRNAVSGLSVDVTINPVFMAFPAEGVEPVLTDWIVGEWETWPDDLYLARCLVGPGSLLALPDGTYDIWVNVVTATEDVKRQVDKLVVT